MAEKPVERNDGNYFNCAARIKPGKIEVPFEKTIPVSGHAFRGAVTRTDAVSLAASPDTKHFLKLRATLAIDGSGAVWLLHDFVILSVAVFQA